MHDQSIPDALRMLLPDRFWKKVDVSGGPDACWIWTASCDTCGYGHFWWQEHLRGTHRLIYEAVNGPLGAGLKCCHHCDNPPCVNPAHLFAGTHSENLLDMGRKGRSNMQRHPERSPFRNIPPERLARGTRIGVARLNDEKVREIRRLVAEGKMNINTNEIGNLFGVSRTTIYRVASGESWGHVK